MPFAYQILDHGCDGEQYFPGCGVSFTDYTHVTTGIGNSAREAAEDAHTQMIEVLDKTAITLAQSEDVEAEVRAFSAAPSFDPEDPEISPEWHHYVSIRWRY